MAKGQREISVSEFFSKNRHLLGFDNPSKVLLTTIKEAVDNSLDACEEAEVAPNITIIVDTGTIIVQDNAGGIDIETIKSILDYTIRVSSREAYVSPTRGAQGNALKTLLAMPFVLDGTTGTTVIETRAERHTITFRVDQLRCAGRRCPPPRAWN